MEPSIHLTKNPIATAAAPVIGAREAAGGKWPGQDSNLQDPASEAGVSGRLHHRAGIAGRLALVAGGNQNWEKEKADDQRGLSIQRIATKLGWIAFGEQCGRDLPGHDRRAQSNRYPPLGE